MTNFYHKIVLIGCFLLASVCSEGKGIDFFNKLNALEGVINSKSLVDSINQMPYDVMVENFEVSSQWFNKALNLALENRYAPGAASAKARLGTITYLQGDYQNSLKYNLEAIHLFDSLHLEVEKGAVLCELGYQMKRRNLSEAFQYFRQGIGLLEKNNAVSKLSSGYDNFGVLYEFRNDYDSAAIYYHRALDIKLLNNDSIGIPYSLNNLALLEIEQGNFAVAKEFFDQALSIRTQRGDVFGIAENKSYYGDLYRKWSNWNEAIVWYERSIADCNILKYPRQNQYNYEMLSDCFEQLGQPDKALEALRKSVQIKEELLNEQNSKAMLELEQRFKSAEKDKNIAVLESAKSKRTLWIFVILAALVLLIFGGILYNQNLRRKAKSQRDAAIIAEREAGLRAVFDATEDERKRIAKDLHDGIGQQLSGLRISLEALQISLVQDVPEKSEKLLHLNEILDDACSDVRSISHRMMPKTLQEYGLLPAMQELLKKSLGITSIAYRLEHFKLENQRFDERVEIALYRVSQELIGNIIKHSKATEVSVQMLRNNSNLILIIEDNGIGFDPNKKADGIGLLNISNRLNTVNGDVTWEPGPNSGVVVSVRIKLVN